MAAQEELLRMFTALPRNGTPAAELTERDKLALCIAAGAQVVCEMNDGFMTARTAAPCGVVDRGDGGYIVGVVKD